MGVREGPTGHTSSLAVGGRPGWAGESASLGGDPHRELGGKLGVGAVARAEREAGMGCRGGRARSRRHPGGRRARRGHGGERGQRQAQAEAPRRLAPPPPPGPGPTSSGRPGPPPPAAGPGLAASSARAQPPRLVLRLRLPRGPLGKWRAGAGGAGPHGGVADRCSSGFRRPEPGDSRERRRLLGLGGGVGSGQPACGCRCGCGRSRGHGGRR